jgi:hypothetical protein
MSSPANTFSLSELFLACSSTVGSGSQGQPSGISHLPDLIQG